MKDQLRKEIYQLIKQCFNENHKNGERTELELKLISWFYIFTAICSQNLNVKFEDLTSIICYTKKGTDFLSAILSFDFEHECIILYLSHTKDEPSLKYINTSSVHARHFHAQNSYFRKSPFSLDELPENEIIDYKRITTEADFNTEIKIIFELLKEQN